MSAEEEIRLGDIVSRGGDDEQEVVAIDDDGYCGTFRCIKAPSAGWCSVGDEERNLVYRYSLVRRAIVTPRGISP